MSSFYESLKKLDLPWWTLPPIIWDSLRNGSFNGSR